MMLTISFTFLWPLCMFISISSSTYLYVYNKDAPNDRYCILALYGKSDEERSWNALCQNESPVVELKRNSGAFELAIISGFPSTDYTSPYTLSKAFQGFLWTESYEFVWVASDGCLYHSVTPNDINIFSAAFRCDPWIRSAKNANPYYWHGRYDFDHRSQLPQSGIGSEELGLVANGDDEGLNPFPLPFPDIGGTPPGFQPNGNQLASVPSGDDGTRFEDFPLASPPDLENVFFTSQTGHLPLDTDIFDDRETGLGEDLFASTGEGSSSMNLFSFTDSDTSSDSGDKTLAFNEAETKLFSK